jgi:hypothetical protein
MRVYASHARHLVCASAYSREHRRKAIL